MKIASVVRTASLLALATITQVSAQTKPPWVTPGVYSAMYACPGQRPEPVDFYVFDRNIVIESSSQKREVQGLRVDVRGGSYIATVNTRFSGQVFFSGQTYDRPPAGGWSGTPSSFSFVGAPEQMNGVAHVGSQDCPMRPHVNPHAKTLNAVSLARDYSTRRDAVPEAFQLFRPAQVAADAIAAVVLESITGDSDSWTVNRLDRTSIGNFNFFSSPSDPSVIYVWSFFRYKDKYGIPTDGWATARLKETSVECIVWHDRSGEGVPPQVRCIPPRLSSSAQMAKLGAGRQRLGPMSVAATCFADRKRIEVRRREIAVPVDRRGNVEMSTERYYETVNETIYTCASQSFELECIAKGLSDRLVEAVAGSGSTRVHKIDLVKDRATDVTASGIAGYNARIQDGTCVRVR